MKFLSSVVNPIAVTALFGSDLWIYYSSYSRKERWFFCDHSLCHI